MKDLIILQYQHLIDHSSPNPLDDLSIAVRGLDAQMSYLKQYDFNVISLSSVVQCLWNDLRLPESPIVLTFDGGYLEHYTHAFPILQRYDLPATCFIPTSYIGKFSDWDAEQGHTPAPLMGWDQIYAMKPYDIEFGSLTANHVALDTVDDNIALAELTASKQLLESKLGTSIYTMAYSWNRMTQETTLIASLAGYLGACGSLGVEESVFNLWRVPLQPTMPLIEFKLLVNN